MMCQRIREFMFQAYGGAILTRADAPLHRNRWFSVFLRQGYYTIEPNQEQVAILPTVGEEVVLVRVYRPVVGLSILEFPAGGVEAGESPLEAARRELAEETGILVEDLTRFRPLPPITICPDRMPICPHLFQVAVSEAEYAARGPFDHEIEEIRRLSRLEAQAAASDGSLFACLPLALLFRHFCRPRASGDKP